MRTLVATLLGGLLLTGCGVLGDSEEDALAAGRETCRHVAAGIGAFNRNALTETVMAFEKALEPAREYERLRGSDDARALREAVEYYAALPAADYRKAFEGSAEFRVHQETTLGQCTQPGQPMPSQPEEQQI